MKYRAVIWDLDGTLVDSNQLHAEAWRDAFLQFGIDHDLETFLQQIGKGGDLLVPDLLNARQVREIGDDLSEVRSKIFREQYRDRVEPFPFVREALEKIREGGARNVIASSASEEDLEFFLDLLDVDDLLDDRTSSDDVESSKPQPDVFEAAMKKVGAPPEELIVVGDTPWDVIAAHRAGIEIAAVRTGGWDEKGLAGAERIFDDGLDAARAIVVEESRDR